MPDPAQIFQAYKNHKIAIYGLSVSTESLLNDLGDGYQIVGLLDGCRTEGELYGKPILSMEAAIQCGIALILVAARPESCKAIAKRIGQICKEHQIALLDIRGTNLCEQKKTTYSVKDLGGKTKAQFIQAIKAHDVISVDMFDTLVMRQILFPTDVFELVDARLRKQGIFIEDFCKKRLESEKELGRHTVPTLPEIYAYIKGNYAMDGIEPDEAAELEWAVDRELTVPRRELCRLLQETYRQGKPVFIVSDTFYSKQQLAGLLEACGITQYTDILTSCDFRTGKTGSLFEKLKERIPGKRCIHIGDSADADVLGAEKSGITSCRIYSGLDLFEQVGYLGLWDELDTLPAKIQAGLFVSRLFNSPFQFEPGSENLAVDSAYEIGFLMFAPLITNFLLWFDGQVRQNGLQNVWFCARDGYLMKRLYDMLDRPAASVYFLTSRIAAIRAGMETGEDIRYVEEMRFSGTMPEQLKERFGIVLSRPKSTASEERLLDYAPEILAAAAGSRKNYQAYMQQIELQEGNIAFFDFVARGTVQMYIGRMIDRRLKGLYFLQQDEDYMRKNQLDILPFYQKEEAADGGFAGSYYILETVLTSPAPSVTGFDKHGAAQYAGETRTAADIACIQTVQNGIADYVRTYLKLCPAECGSGSKRLSEVLLSLIHRLEIRNADFLNLKVEDPFFNRTTDLSDLL